MSSRGLTKVPTKEQKYVKSEVVLISAKIQAQRQKMGFTQEKMAEILNVSPETIRFIEQNRRIPSLPMLIRIAKVLNMKILD